MNKTDLIEQTKKLPEQSRNSRPPHWGYWQNVTRDWIIDANNDPEKFYLCPSVYHCMLVNHWPNVVDDELADLPGEYLRFANMPFISTNDYIGHSELSRNMVHQLYHFWLWEQFSGKKIRELESIVEVGAGYGAMALLARRLGFQGDYYIYDLPEFCLLQEYFLTNTLIYHKGVRFNQLPLPKHTDLLIACYSLSEMPIAERKGYLYDIDARSYLFLFSQEWVDYDNLHYFKQFAELTPHAGTWEWLVKPSRYLPEGNWYSFGNRIDNGQI